MQFRFFLFLPLAFSISCRSLPESAHEFAAFPKVSRSETLAIAETYRTHRWFATRANVRHGLDSRGIRVDTPDIGYRIPGAIPGWWIPGEWNEGVPYQWGGFSTLTEFDTGVSAGLAVGDVYTQAKRNQLDDAVSQEAVGIDCSGFISRCWCLPRSFSTRELAGLCDRLASWDELMPGDVLNTHNAHCLLFAGWADPQRKSLLAYETGSPPDWKVVSHAIDVAWLKSLGYQPLRYRKIVP